MTDKSPLPDAPETADCPSASCSPFAGVTNLAYIVIFLRNGGERLRAIWLAKKTLGLEIKEAAAWVDSVKLIPEPMPELLPEYPPADHRVGMVASHWPPTVEAILKANV